MHVTIEIEPRNLPVERIEYGSLLWRKTYVKNPERTVHTVFATIHFESKELEIIGRAGLSDYELWQGPEETRLSDREWKFNLELPRKDGLKRAKYDSIIKLVGFEALVDPQCHHLIYQPWTWRASIKVGDLIDGERRIIYDCPSLAVANGIEHQFGEALVAFKKMLTAHDQPATRVSTFEL